MTRVKVSWSGGKDSTAAVLLHLLEGHSVTAVCYVPMYNEEIPLILPEHYRFILDTAARFRSMGADVRIVSGMTYEDYVLRVTTRGKYKGKIFGFPSYITGQCNFRYYSKMKALNDDFGVYDYEDIGIAFDEKMRHSQLTENKRSILVEYQLSEADARDICIKNDMLSPLYTANVKRDGCALCPHASEEVRERWFAAYPDARELVSQLMDIVSVHRPERMPLRGNRRFY